MMQEATAREARLNADIVLCPACNGSKTPPDALYGHQDRACYLCLGTGRLNRAIRCTCGRPGILEHTSGEFYCGRSACKAVNGVKCIYKR